MPSATLLPHPSTPAPEFSLRVTCARHPGGGLGLSYRLTGPVSKLAIPSLQPAPGRRDQLWRQTCFEAFVRGSDETSYREFNFSPSGDWAIYRFSAYREAMSLPGVNNPPRIHLFRGQDTLQLDVELTPDLLGEPCMTTTTWEVVMSTVMETHQGGLSYWALNHPPGQPDFHHDDSFALRLAP